MIGDRALIATSMLSADPAEVWTWISSAEGINTELSPVHMHAPAHLLNLSAEGVPIGQRLAWIPVTIFGWIPLDLHGLALQSLDPGRGFREQSRTLLHAQWIHERRLEPTPAGCQITDRVGWRTRIPGLGVLIAPVIRKVFRRRHQVLSNRFHGADVVIRPVDPQTLP